MAKPTEDSSRNILERVNLWLAIPIAVATIFGGLWIVIKFFNPIKELDLTVWIQQEIEFSLPKEASSLKKLALVYDGRPMERASLLLVSISNTGNVPIQRVENGIQKPWLLTLRSTNKVPIEQIGDATATPSNVEVSSQPGSTPDTLQLAIGLLNPQDAIEVRLALLGPKGQARYPVDAEARIAGLRKPEVTKLTVRERIRDAFLAPLWVIAIAVVIGGAIWEEYREGWKSFRSAGSAIRMIVGLLFIPIFAGAFLAAGAAWLLAWVVYFVAF
jgi:hypothetical protein